MDLNRHQHAFQSSPVAQPQASLHGQPAGWETVDPSRFRCRTKLQTTGQLNQGICKGDTKQGEAIAKWGTCNEHDILKEHHSHRNAIPYLDGECTGWTGNAWFAMPVAKTDLLQLLQLGNARSHSQKIREGIREGILHMHQHKWVHCDIKPDNILVLHNDEPVLADFGLTTKQGTPATVVEGQVVYPAVYPRYSTMALYNAPVHVNRDWFAFTVVLYEMYFNNPHTTYAQPQSWWESQVVTSMDQQHSSGASRHYGAETKLSPHMYPNPDGQVPAAAAAAAGSRTH